MFTSRMTLSKNRGQGRRRLQSISRLSLHPDSAICIAMNQSVPESLVIIAGKGAYPRLLAESARQQGVRRIMAIAFKKETEKSIEPLVDTVVWINMGQLAAMLDALKKSGIRHVVMAGLIRPTHLFRARPDGALRALLKTLHLRNADTIFGAVGDTINKLGLTVLPASTFMEAYMPLQGCLTRRTPSPVEQGDIELGRHVACVTSGLDIGQTVVIKEGTILAVEAFEGTDKTLLRAGGLGGSGAVIVKIAKRGHDMRFDIPVIGLHTIKIMQKIKAAALAVEAGRCIVLEREKVVAQADKAKLCMIAFEATNVDHRARGPVAKDAS